jgi:hypothetical protein
MAGAVGDRKYNTRRRCIYQLDRFPTKCDGCTDNEFGHEFECGLVTWKNVGSAGPNWEYDPQYRGGNYFEYIRTGNPAECKGYWADCQSVCGYRWEYEFDYRNLSWK